MRSPASKAELSATVRERDQWRAEAEKLKGEASRGKRAEAENQTPRGQLEGAQRQIRQLEASVADGRKELERVSSEVKRLKGEGGKPAAQGAQSGGDRAPERGSSEAGGAGPSGSAAARRVELHLLGSCRSMAENERVCPLQRPSG